MRRERDRGPHQTRTHGRDSAGEQGAPEPAVGGETLHGGHGAASILVDQLVVHQGSGGVAAMPADEPAQIAGDGRQVGVREELGAHVDLAVVVTKAEGLLQREVIVIDLAEPEKGRG